MKIIYTLVLMLLISCTTNVQDKFIVKSKRLHEDDFIYEIGFISNIIETREPVEQVFELYTTNQYEVGDSIFFITKSRLQELKRKEEYYDDIHRTQQKSY